MSGNTYTNNKPVKLFGDSMCEVDDCTSVATTAINVNLGELGFITLYLCENVKMYIRIQRDLK
jgi:hypothetical protein